MALSVAPATARGLWREAQVTHVPNDLIADFPTRVDRIHHLKTTSPHFVHLAERYHELNRTLHRMETDIEPASDETMETLKKERLLLKDQISVMLG